LVATLEPCEPGIDLRLEGVDLAVHDTEQVVDGLELVVVLTELTSKVSSGRARSPVDSTGKLPGG